MTDRGRKTLLPWQLPASHLEAADIAAVKALADGNADAHAQRRVWDFMRRLSGADRMSFWPGGEDGRRATDFAEGKRWVADQLRRIHKMVPSRIDPRDEPPPMPNQEVIDE